MTVQFHPLRPSALTKDRPVWTVPLNRYLDDKSDKTDIWDKNWDEVKTELGDAIGGDYLGVHLRRKDFLYARKEEVPSLSDAISQIKDSFRILNATKKHLFSKLDRVRVFVHGNFCIRHIFIHSIFLERFENLQIKHFTTLNF